MEHRYNSKSHRGWPALLLGLALATGSGCKDKSVDENADAPTADAPTAAAPAPATAPPPAPVATSAGDGEGIVWIDDNWAGALAAAKAQGRPVLVDMWAPWCHTCISMQKTVLREGPIQNRAAEFIWLAVDTDRPENEAVAKKLDISFWPTFFVVDADGNPLARHVGSASLEQFMAFLDTGRGAFAGTLKDDPILAALARADQASSSGEHKDALKAYLEALEKGGPAWPRRFTTRTALLGAYLNAGKVDDCLEHALAHLDDMAASRSASTADYVATAHYCAQRAGDKAARDFAERAAAPGNAIEKVLADPTADLSYDDKSDALRVLRELHLQRGDKEAARAMAERQRTILDDAVTAAADDAELAAGYAWPREEVYVYLGEGDKLLPWFRELVEKLPESYDPPYRLAWLESELGLLEDALVHLEQAKARVYGPRAVRVWWQLAELQEKRKDTDGQRVAWKGVVDTIQGLKDQRRYKDALGAAKSKLDKLD